MKVINLKIDKFKYFYRFADFVSAPCVKFCRERKNEKGGFLVWCVQKNRARIFLFSEKFLGLLFFVFWNF